jgi:hypothetical protein
MATIFMMNEEIARGMVCFFHQKKHSYLILIFRSLTVVVFCSQMERKTVQELCQEYKDAYEAMDRNDGQSAKSLLMNHITALFDNLKPEVLEAHKEELTALHCHLMDSGPDREAKTTAFLPLLMKLLEWNDE